MIWVIVFGFNFTKVYTFHILCTFFGHPFFDTKFNFIFDQLLKYGGVGFA